MRYTLLTSDLHRRPQFAGAARERIVVLDHYIRWRETAKCGCNWSGLVSRVGCARGDGVLTLCEQHALRDADSPNGPGYGIRVPY